MRAFSSWLLLLASVLVLASLSASAQTASTPPPATSDPQAVALIQKALAALTSGEPVTDVTLTGSARRIAGSDDETGTAALTALPGGYSKLSLDLPSGPRTEIRNPSATPLLGAFPGAVTLPTSATQAAQPAGAWSGTDGVLHGMATHNVMTDATWFFPLFTVASMASGNYVLSSLDQETLDGQAVLHVSASQQFSQVGKGGAGTLVRHFSQLDMYLDPITSLPVALAFNIHPDGNALTDIPVLIQFSSYQATGGAQVPLHVQKFINNGLALDLTFTNVTFNSGLTAASFQLQ